MMFLEYERPYKVNSSSIEDGKRLDNPDSTHYGRFSIVSNKLGFVTISEMDWAHNNGRSYFTLFGTILNGYKYSAWLNEARLSDRQLKYMSTKFIKGIKTQTNVEI